MVWWRSICAVEEFIHLNVTVEALSGPQQWEICSVSYDLHFFLIFLLFHANTRCFGGRRESLATSFCLLFALVMKRIKTFHKNKTSKDLLLLLLTYEQYIGMSQPFTTTFSLLSLNFFSSNFFSLTKSLFFNFHTACFISFYCDFAVQLAGFILQEPNFPIAQL